MVNIVYSLTHSLICHPDRHMREAGTELVAKALHTGSYGYFHPGCTEAASRESLALVELLVTCQVHHQHHLAWVPGGSPRGLGLVLKCYTSCPVRCWSRNQPLLQPHQICTLHLPEVVLDILKARLGAYIGTEWINSHPNHKPRPDSTLTDSLGLVPFENVHQI